MSGLAAQEDLVEVSNVVQGLRDANPMARIQAMLLIDKLPQTISAIDLKQMIDSISKIALESSIFLCRHTAIRALGRMCPWISAQNQALDVFRILCKASFDCDYRNRMEAMLQMPHCLDSCNFSENQICQFLSNQPVQGVQKWNHYVESEDTEDSVSVANSFQCGVVLSALEDDFFQVRQSGVSVLKDIWNCYPGFMHVRRRLTDLLLFMLSDMSIEIQLFTLKTMSDIFSDKTLLILNSSTLVHVLPLLKAADVFLRRAALALLKVVQVDSYKAFATLCSHLLSCAERFQDSFEVLCACSSLGVRHASMLTDWLQDLKIPDSHRMHLALASICKLSIIANMITEKPQEAGMLQLPESWTCRLMCLFRLYPHAFPQPGLISSEPKPVRALSH
jgi:hypothetical protein